MANEDWDDDPGFDNVDDDEDFDLPFDCHMGPDGYCGAAGSEDCEFECPVMAEIIRSERVKAKK